MIQCVNCNISYDDGSLQKFSCTASICSICIQKQKQYGSKRITCNSCNRKHNIGSIDSTQIYIHSSSSQTNTFQPPINELVVSDDLIESYKEIEYNSNVLKKYQNSYKDYLLTLKNCCLSNKINILENIELFQM